MDPVGVTLGTAALVSTVLDVFRLVTSFRSYPESSSILFRQLELEREVLHRWATEVGLQPPSEAPSRCAIPPELLPLVDRSVAAIGALLGQATSIKATKGVLEVGVSDLKLVHDTLQNEIANHKQSRLARSLARLGWAIGEEDRLKDLISTIHSYNTSLHNLIPKPLQVSLDGSLMQILLADHDKDRLLEIQQASSHWRKALSVAASVTALQQGHALAPPSTNQLIVNRSKLSSVGPDMSRHLTQYTLKNEKIDVLVEWRAYRAPPNSAEKTAYLNTCLDLARLLHTSQNLPEYRTLDCVGVIDDIEFRPHPRIGLVYRVPPPTLPSTLDESVRTYTLHDIINRKEFARPKLEQRFEIGRSLATGLHRLFVSRWYHKNLNSKNILFFAQGSPADEKPVLSNTDFIAHPFLSGFDYARPDSPDEMTIKPEVNEFSDRYQHPRCTNPATRHTIPFSRQFDVYSLGVILIELGRWETVDTMHKDFKAQCLKAAKKGQGPDEPPGLEMFQKYLKTRCVDSLGFRMGTIYTDAVRFCFHDASLTGAESGLDEDIEEVLISRFNKEVVAELVKCTA
ncbi:prion-inhibition and propagation-domain-containing protein [Aspergillus granulosus]|uniref:Prion-inhibition and propagation-domain-containing protein n=1 Tax=Aspergillus granulosus TaxID=176169 RepID=A0ABR4GX73_9EURO